MPILDCLSAYKGENRCPIQFCFDGKVGRSMWNTPDIYLHNLLLTMSNGALSKSLDFNNNSRNSDDQTSHPYASIGLIGLSKIL